MKLPRRADWFLLMIAVAALGLSAAWKATPVGTLLRLLSLGGIAIVSAVPVGERFRLAIRLFVLAVAASTLDWMYSKGIVNGTAAILIVAACTCISVAGIKQNHS